LLLGFFIEVAELNSGLQKGFLGLHDFFKSLESHGAHPSWGYMVRETGKAPIKSFMRIPLKLIYSRV
jgi:hypothetical protein